MNTNQTNSECPPPAIAAEIVESILNDALERGVIEDMMDSGGEIPESAMREAVALIRELDREALLDYFQKIYDYSPYYTKGKDDE